MSDKKPEYGLLIDYEYCTGCHACEVACAQEFHREAGIIKGIEVLEVEQKLPMNRRTSLIYRFRLSNAFCVRTAPRRGIDPACVRHCMAACMKYGRIEELAKEMQRKPRMVLWVPRA